MSTVFVVSAVSSGTIILVDLGVVISVPVGVAERSVGGSDKDRRLLY
jgi:hypothetical protein